MKEPDSIVENEKIRNRQLNECFVCGTELNATNSSDEHILLNALGGHLHSPTLLCKRCNSVFGCEFDGELARELNFAASYLNVPRQRGKNQTIYTNKCEEYNLLPGGKPVLKKPIVKTSSQEIKDIIEITARNENEARRIIKELSRKNPRVDVDSALKQMKTKKEYIGKSIAINISFHAKKIYPSIIKSAVEYYLFCGGDRQKVSHILTFIEGKGDVGECCKYYYPVEPLFDISDDEIMHLLYIIGSSKDRLLYGFVSYFGIVQCIILLSDNYDGPDMEYGYGYNVITRDEKAIKPRYYLSKDSILKIVHEEYFKLTVPMRAYIQAFLRKAQNYRWSQQIETFFSIAWDRTIGQHQKNVEITNEMKKSFLNEFFLLASPLLAAYLFHEE